MVVVVATVVVVVVAAAVQVAAAVVAITAASTEPQFSLTFSNSQQRKTLDEELGKETHGH